MHRNRASTCGNSNGFQGRGFAPNVPTPGGAQPPQSESVQNTWVTPAHQRRPPPDSQPTALDQDSRPEGQGDSITGAGPLSLEDPSTDADRDFRGAPSVAVAEEDSDHRREAAVGE